MNRKRISTLLLACLLAATWATGCWSGSPLAGQPTAVPALALDNCQLSSPLLGNQIAARCGRLEVPENRADPNGRKIGLRVVVVKAQSANPAPDPLFLLAGGPGQAASEAYIPLIPALERIAFKHDLVLVDQRGTGQSNPLRCEGDESAELNDAGFPAPEAVTAAFQDCLPRLDADPRFYTTAEFAADLEAVRQALGYGQIDLLGVSYGTRSALEYVKTYPDNVRAVILDGVVPPGWNIGQSLRADAQRSLELIFERCAADAGCKNAYPDLRGDLRSLLERLNANPETVVLPDPLTGEDTTLEMDGRMAGAMLRLISYSSDYSALIPWLLHTAALGDPRPLAAQYLIANKPGGQGGIEPGLFYAVMCAEDMPFLPGGESGEFFFYDPLPNFRAACKAYPDNPRPAVAEFPSGLRTPALILSGEADPVTPPANGDAAAALLTNSRHIVLPGMGHGNVAYGCIPNLAAELFDNPDPAALDLTCVQRIAPPPFFLTALGPEP